MRNLLVVMGLFGLFNMDCVNAGIGASSSISQERQKSDISAYCTPEQLQQFCERLRGIKYTPDGVAHNFSDVTPRNIGNRWRELCENEFFAVDAVTVGFYGIAEFLIQQREGDIKEKSLYLMLSACIGHLQGMVNEAMKEQKNDQNQSGEFDDDIEKAFKALEIGSDVPAHPNAEVDSELQSLMDEMVSFSPQNEEKFTQMVKFIIFLVERKGGDIMNVEYSNGKTVRMLLTELVDRIVSPDFGMVLELLNNNGSLKDIRNAMSFAITSGMIDNIGMELGRSFKF